jgi:hypothetical protein
MASALSPFKGPFSDTLIVVMKLLLFNEAIA